MPHRQLPKNPSLVHLRNQARDLMAGKAACNPAVLQRIREFHPSFNTLTDGEIVSHHLKLSDAQLVIAREAAYPSWPKLKAAVQTGQVPDEGVSLEDRIQDPVFRAAVSCIDTGDVAELRRLLSLHPHLVRQHVYYSASNYFGQPGLLQFVAQNPIRQASMPNALEIASTIIVAGASQSDLTKTLGLVATGRIPREEGVQVLLIDLLCSKGAIIKGMAGAMAHGEFGAVEAMIRHGGQVTLPIAAGLDRQADFELLFPTSTALERHLALAFAAQFGRVQILRTLLEAGEDPNRYNPPGAHAHSTPLHQAVVHGRAQAVQVLLQSGAKADIPDTLFEGTALGWAEYEGLADMAKMLREFAVE